jgi:uncharacterized repeat protein (TIGR03803 family)
LHNDGVIFKIQPDGTGFLKLYDFHDTGNGSAVAYGTLVSDGTFLYGMTTLGGQYDFGTVFKIKPDGSSFTKLLDFSDTLTGIYPYGSLTLINGILYGLTSAGGTYGDGTLFSIKVDGSNFLKLYNFNGASGANPAGSLYFDSANLYGMAQYGGLANSGVIFKYGLSIGIDELENIPPASIYPNPAHGELNIHLSSGVKDAEINIYDVTGRLIYGQPIINPESKIKNAFSPGIYFVRIEAGARSCIVKLVVD